MAWKTVTTMEKKPDLYQLTTWRCLNSVEEWSGNLLRLEDMLLGQYVTSHASWLHLSTTGVTSAHIHHESLQNVNSNFL